MTDTPFNDEELLILAGLRDECAEEGNRLGQETLQHAINSIAGMRQLLIEKGIWNRCHFCCNMATLDVNLGGPYGGQVVHVCHRCGTNLTEHWGGPAEIVKDEVKP